MEFCLDTQILIISLWISTMVTIINLLQCIRCVTNQNSFIAPIIHCSVNKLWSELSYESPFPNWIFLLSPLWRFIHWIYMSVFFIIRITFQEISNFILNKLEFIRLNHFDSVITNLHSNQRLGLLEFIESGHMIVK